MRNKQTIVDVVVDVDTEQAQSVTAAFDGLRRVIGQIGRQIADVFAALDFSKAISQTVNMTKFTEKFSDQLLYLRLNLGRLKAAISEAAAPIGAVLLPLVNQAVNAMVRLTGSIGLVLGALVDGVLGTDAVADSAENAARAEESLESAAVSAAKAVRRSLAGFDQIERLDAPTASDSTVTQAVLVQPQVQLDTLSPQLQAVVSKVLELIAPLKQIDLSPLMAALERLGTVFGTVSGQIGGVLEWLWYELLVPLATWILQALAPALGQNLASALELVSAVLTPVFEGIRVLWEALQPVAEFIGQVVITVLGAFREAFDVLAQVIRDKGPQIRQIFEDIAGMVARVWEVVSPILQLLLERWISTFGSMSTKVADTVGFVIDALSRVTGFLSGDFTNDWRKAWENMNPMLKGIVNGVVFLLNTMLDRIADTMNAIIKLTNGMSFQVPDWVPGLGGQSFSFGMKSVTAPQIPYLAKGAVLPANRPFLAVVGDQRHGTNVEAPLATIQKAVAVVMEDMIASNLAGQEAIVGVLRQILEAVLGIRIGDADIARAVDRYRSKMAVVYGTGRI